MYKRNKRNNTIWPHEGSNNSYRFTKSSKWTGQELEYKS